MDHGVEPAQIVDLDVADVHRSLLVALRLRAEVAAVVPADVETDDLVPGLLQERHQHGADVAAISVDQYLHLLSPV